MADDKKRDDFTLEMGDRNGKNFERPVSPLRHNTAPLGAAVNNPIFPVLSYCASSILMTVTNKFVLSGLGFNLNFFLLCVQVRLVQGELGSVLILTQSVVCVLAIQICKSSGMITYRDFNTDEARKCMNALLRENRLQALTRSYRVPRIIIAYRYHIYQHQGPSVPLDPRLHYI